MIPVVVLTTLAVVAAVVAAVAGYAAIAGLTYKILVRDIVIPPAPSQEPHDRGHGVFPQLRCQGLLEWDQWHLKSLAYEYMCIGCWRHAAARAEIKSARGKAWSWPLIYAGWLMNGVFNSAADVVVARTPKRRLNASREPGGVSRASARQRARELAEGVAAGREREGPADPNGSGRRSSTGRAPAS